MFFVIGKPGRPKIQLTDTVVYAGQQTSIKCLFTSGPDGTDGNPPVDEFSWFIGNHFVERGVNYTINMLITSIYQEGIVSCFGSNYVDGGRENSPLAEPQILHVRG